jgi:hypothetical protein
MRDLVQMIGGKLCISNKISPLTSFEMNCGFDARGRVHGRAEPCLRIHRMLLTNLLPPHGVVKAFLVYQVKVLARFYDMAFL